MNNNAQKPVMIAVHSDKSVPLESFRALQGAGLQIGALQERRRIEEAKLTPWEVTKYAYQVVAVIGSIGGAVQFIDWVLEKARAARTGEFSARVQIGAVKIDIAAEDPEELKRRLQALLPKDGES